MKLHWAKNSVLTTLLLGLLACVSSQSAFSTDFSIDAVYFNEGVPAKGGNLDASLVDSNESLQVMKNDADAIKSLKPPHQVRIVGHTDSKECSGKACDALSLRRAQLVFNWMVANGVPTSMLLAPEGHGRQEPVANNDIPKGRAKNRYVEFQVVPSTP